MHMHTVKSIEYINVTHNSDPEKEQPSTSAQDQALLQPTDLSLLCETPSY